MSLTWLPLWYDMTDTVGAVFAAMISSDR